MAGQLVLKSQNAVSDIIGLLDIQYYIDRVTQDGGVINNTAELLEAFSFIYASGISLDKIVSATNPMWGIKKNASNVVSKLYSLFDPAGDIDFATSGTIKPMYDVTNKFPSVYFGGSESCYGKLFGLFNATASVSTVTVNAIPVGVAYGSLLSFPVSLVWSESNFRADAATSPANYLTLARSIIKPSTTDVNSATWWNTVAVSTSNVGSATTAINASAKPIAAYMSTQTGLDILSHAGSVAHGSIPPDNSKRLTNLTFQLGISVNGSGVLTGNIVSHFFENWVFRDTSITETLLITQRVNNKYYNKV